MVGTSNLGGKPPFSYGFSDVFPISHWFSYGFWTTTEPTTTCRHPIRPGQSPRFNRLFTQTMQRRLRTATDKGAALIFRKRLEAPTTVGAASGPIKNQLWQLWHGRLPSGKPTKKYGKSQFQRENPLFLWSFSIAMLNYQRVIMIITVVLTMFFFPITYLFMIFQLSIDYNGSVMDCNGSATFDYQSWGG